MKNTEREMDDAFNRVTSKRNTDEEGVKKNLKKEWLKQSRAVKICGTILSSLIYMQLQFQKEKRQSMGQNKYLVG